MKILYIHQYFRTPYEPGGTRSYWISQELIKAGHEVIMLTTSERRMDTEIERTNIDGIQVIYFNVPYHNAMGVFRRFFSFVRFMLKSLVIAWKEKDIDLVIATSTPLTVGFPALVLKKLKGMPYVFEVRDLWPEVPIQMGALKNKFFIFLAQWFEKSIYKNARHIVALSPGMRDGVLAQKVKSEKVTMIPNMSKIDAFWPREKDVALIDQMGLRRDSFKIIYFGAMGAANAMDYIYKAAKELQNDDGIEFLFMGSGFWEPKLRKMSKEDGLDHMHFYGNIAMEQLSKIVNFSDVSLVTFSNLPILSTNSPNKLFDSLSAGKAIVVNSPGWTKTMVEEHNCGIYVNGEDPKDMVEKIRFLKNNPAVVKKMGDNARVLAETEYDKSILCSKFVDVIDSLNITSGKKQ